MSKTINVVVVFLTAYMGCTYESAETHISDGRNMRRRTGRPPLDSVEVYRMSNAARDRRQIYIEDSVSVFWTRYPDPFGPVPSVYINCVGQQVGFYNGLRGNLEIGVIGQQTDSLRFSFNSLRSMHSYFWVCIADEKLHQSDLKEEYFKSLSNELLDLVLIVDGRYKSRLPLGIRVPEGKYLLLSWSTRYVKGPVLK